MKRDSDKRFGTASPLSSADGVSLKSLECANVKSETRTQSTQSSYQFIKSVTHLLRSVRVADPCAAIRSVLDTGSPPAAEGADVRYASR